MTQEVQRMPCKYEGVNLDPQYPPKSQDPPSHTHTHTRPEARSQETSQGTNPYSIYSVTWS